jgi:hypothetical protein
LYLYVMVVCGVPWWEVRTRGTPEWDSLNFLSISS